MSASNLRHWQRRFIAGAGLACLGAGGILVSGCTTPTTAELNAPRKKDRQVAKSTKSSAATKAAPKIAAKEPSGKARISDLDRAASTQIVAQRVPAQTDGSKQPVAQTRRPETQLASASIDPQAAAAKRPGMTKADAISVAAKPRTPATSRSAETPASNEVAAGTVRDNGPIKQTAGNGQSATAARKTRGDSNSVESKSVEAKRVVAELAKRPVAQPENREPKAAEADPLASNHERRRSDRLMERAHLRYRSGYPEEALRLASVAFELEKSGQAVYRRGEERPSDYITWLQSVAGVRTSVPPLIRPKGSDAQQVAVASPAGSDVAADGAESSAQRRTGDVIRANAGSNAAAPTDIAVVTADGTRPNSGVELAAPTAPRFTVGDSPTVRAGANAGQVEVPPPPTPRSADASLAMANSSGPSLDAPAVADANGSANKTEKPAEQAPPVPEAGTVQKSVQKSEQAPSTAFVALDESPAEGDVFAESETPGLIPGRTTQLTIASLVGLITGIGGMFGLSWWRRQEQRHYAAGK